jgi:hypothetical protein
MGISLPWRLGALAIVREHGRWVRRQFEEIMTA